MPILRESGLGNGAIIAGINVDPAAGQAVEEGEESRGKVAQAPAAWPKPSQPAGAQAEDYRDQRERVEAILERITYKPGWEFGARWALRELSVRISCAYQTQDVNHSNSQIYVGLLREFSVETLASMRDEDIVDMVIRSVIDQAERHEIDEWFKFDGKHVRDPHPEAT